jgi:Rrf2 family protein
MQVSRKVDYALRAVIYLSQQDASRPMPAKEIASRRRIPIKFLEKIIRDLMHHGIVRSHRGAHGGYTLNRSPGQISCEVIEPSRPDLLNVCVAGQNDCSVLSSCNMQRVWQEGQRRVMEYFSETTLADLTGSVNTGPTPPV